MFKPDGTFKDKAGIKSAFETAGVDLSKPIVTSCGSGVTACVLIFGLFLIGKTDVALYDGSWAEWGADPETPKETGASRPVNA
jgi:thiosulfate/3-mercaptopyruvate sulfurtransferase